MPAQSIPSTRIMPGFPAAMGYTLFWLSLIVLLPMAALVASAFSLSGKEFLAAITDPITVAAYKLTIFTSLAAALINGICGLIVVWTLTRYEFPGRRVLDALIDAPFALPTAVAGLTFASLFQADGWYGALGDHLTQIINTVLAALHAPIVLPPHSLSVLNMPLANTNGGIVIVLVFVGLPFVIRTVQPLLQDWDREYENAARSLGAGRWTIFRRVIFPELFPAWLSGVSLAFARGLGEYGSVIFIASNIPGKSQIAPLQIVAKLDQFKYGQAAAIGVVLLGFSLLVLLLLNVINRMTARGRD